VLSGSTSSSDNAESFGGWSELTGGMGYKGMDVEEGATACGGSLVGSGSVIW
jgi:hypothetical protein